DNTEEAKEWRKELAENLAKNAYDVIIFGDVPASRFAPRTPEGAALLEQIRKKVESGAGFLMIGGQESFGDGGWEQTPLAPLVPVDVTTKGQLEGRAGNELPIKFIPTDQ